VIPIETGSERALTGWLENGDVDGSWSINSCFTFTGILFTIKHTVGAVENRVCVCVFWVVMVVEKPHRGTISGGSIPCGVKK